jgi:hypothetical protein
MGDTRVTDTVRTLRYLADVRTAHVDVSGYGPLVDHRGRRFLPELLRLEYELPFAGDWTVTATIEGPGIRRDGGYAQTRAVTVVVEGDHASPSELPGWALESANDHHPTRSAT